MRSPPRRLADLSAATEVPYRVAMLHRVSPRRTTWEVAVRDTGVAVEAVAEVGWDPPRCGINSRWPTPMRWGLDSLLARWRAATEVPNR